MEDTATSLFVPSSAGHVLQFAARELMEGLGAMCALPPALGAADELAGNELVLGPALEWAGHAPARRGYAIAHAGQGLRIAGASEREVLDGVYRLMRELGARYPIGAPVVFPRLTPQELAARITALPELNQIPPFSRRAMVSDIMTWHYADPSRFELHLEHDRQFIPWMARRGINAFFFIRHRVDKRYRIDELEPIYRERGIALEYGGHIIEQLLPRESFAMEPELFAMGPDGVRSARGNLCVASDRALEIVGANALDYLRYSEGRLHVWGADVWNGAWCACPSCTKVAPQAQYLKVVNAIARAAAPIEIDYLGYHDTLEPAPGLVPEPNVWLEWAPRERCYRHGIDDSGCEVNRRYFAALRRYLDLFEGRCHVFEYYADAVLYGGQAAAQPAIIARDLRAYNRIGVRSISCLTFGAFSIFAYPANLCAFADLTRDLDAAVAVESTAAERYPRCSEIAAAYREIERASHLVLTYGDVMRPEGISSREKDEDLRQASDCLRRAIEVSAAFGGGRLAAAERSLWTYGARSLDALREYIAARDAGQREAGLAAIEKMADALSEIRAIDLEIKGTWGAFDLERFHQGWLNRMRRFLDAA